MTTFRQLNEGWNAEPNAPNPQVQTQRQDLVLSFYLNSMQFPSFEEGDVGILRFSSCHRYRLGPTNDEGWYRGHCRFSKLAPRWGEFYEVIGDLRLSECQTGWIDLDPAPGKTRHFLFYFRDETFECDAMDLSFEVLKAKSRAAADNSPGIGSGTKDRL